MSVGSEILVAPLLAFQVWDLFGWAGQILFTARVAHQWYFSEKAGRSHVTAMFWWYSLAGTAMLLVYILHRKDPVFLVGPLVSGLPPLSAVRVLSETTIVTIKFTSSISGLRMK